MTRKRKTLLALCLCSSIFSPTHATNIHRTDTELKEHLIVTGKERQAHILYSIGPLHLHAGDIVDIRVQAVVTHECKGNVGIGRYLIRTNNPGSTSGKRVIKAVMSNVGANDHHGVLVHSGIDEVETDSFASYYNFIIYAQSTQCQVTKVKVEGYGNSGFGEMVVRMER